MIQSPPEYSGEPDGEGKSSDDVINKAPQKGLPDNVIPVCVANSALIKIMYFLKKKPM